MDIAYVIHYPHRQYVGHHTKRVERCIAQNIYNVNFGHSYYYFIGDNSWLWQCDKTLINLSLRARYERGNPLAMRDEDAQLRDCFVRRNDKINEAHPLSAKRMREGRPSAV